MTYERSYLYLHTLAARDNDPYVKEREMLRVAYENARREIIPILNQISKDFPNLTRHDITHVDALWNVGSVIVGDSYEINPLEGFVLGCAFLVHDAALSYITVGGKDELRELQYWKDTYAEFEGSVNMTKDEILNMVDFITIRRYHASKASELIKNPIKTERGDIYILENQSIRNHLSDIIGEIAASHHWSIDRVGEMPTQFNAPLGFDNSWYVNPQKLACILRCADAGHIDMGRAPDRLLQILHLHGLSANHWKAQNHLAMITVDKDHTDRAIITSTNPYKEDEFSAWNVAYDAIKVLDAEIKASNVLLARQSAALQFAIKEVAGASSKSQLSRYIQTKDWIPCEANVHIDDVADIVMKLGGEALYGRSDKMLVAVRELVQNARDAIYARAQQEKSFNIENGYINVDVSKVNGDVYLEVSDNGVGMSENIIKNVFLSFGNSLWHSPLVKSEFPGLRSSSFSPIGQYGIGFYSVFMIADEVIVETRQYKKGTNTTIQLKFPNGLTLTPIMRVIDSNDTMISTKITVKINPKRYKWKDSVFVLLNQNSMASCDVPVEALLKSLFAGLDMQVHYSVNHSKNSCIHQNINQADFDVRQWLRDISFADYRKEKYLDDYIDSNYQRLERINIPGKVKGLAAINTLQNIEEDYLSIDTVGGLANLTNLLHRDSRFYIGYLDYTPISASRNWSYQAEDMHLSDLQSWSKHQYDLCKSTLTMEQRITLPYLLAKLGVDSIDICMTTLMNVADGKTENLSISAIINNLKQNNEHLVFIMRESLGDIYHVDTSILYDMASIRAILPDYDNSYRVIVPTHCNENYSILRVADDKNSLIGYINREAKKQGVKIKTEQKKIVLKNGPYNMPYDVHIRVLSCK